MLAYLRLYGATGREVRWSYRYEVQSTGYRFAGNMDILVG